jgi:tRNA(Ile)-lysidine synthase
LHAVAAASGLAVAEDPSNADPRFDRVRMRAAMPQLAAVGLDARRLAETAARLGRAAAALDHYAGALLRERFAADRFGVVRGEAAALAGAPEEVALRALARLLRAAGGGDYTPRLEAVEALLAAILGAGKGGRARRTLAGVVVTAADGTVDVRREWGRQGLAEIAAPAGAMLLWDRRFEVAVPRLGGALSVGALACSPRRLRAERTEAAALGTLPGLYRNGTLVAVPDAVSAADDGEPLQGLAAECIVGPRLGLGCGETLRRA